MTKTRIIGMASAIGTAIAVLASPLLALAYFATADGLAELESGSVSSWALPLKDELSGLLSFGSPDAVYATYSLLFAALFPVVVIATAFTTRSLRSDAQTRSERSSWRVALTGYALFGIGLAATSIALAGGLDQIVDPSFLFVMVPGLLLSFVGSTWLGIALLRGGYRPKVTAWILTGVLPAWLVTSTILGHNSIGVTVLMVAWGITGLSLIRSATALDAPDVKPSHVVI